MKSRLWIGLVLALACGGAMALTFLIHPAQSPTPTQLAVSAGVFGLFLTFMSDQNEGEGCAIFFIVLSMAGMASLASSLPKVLKVFPFLPESVVFWAWLVPSHVLLAFTVTRVTRWMLSKKHTAD